MRLALMIYGSLDTLSGGYLYDRKLVETLRAQGDQVEIISMPWRSYAGRLGQNFARIWLERVVESRPDILLQDELNHPSLFYLNRRLRQRLEGPIISIVHHLRSSEQHPELVKRLYRQVEQAYLRGVDGFIYNSQTTRQVVEALRGSAAHCVVATPAGDRFQGRLEVPRRADGPVRFLFVGNLIARKCLHTLLEALVGLDGIDWQLTVVGREDVDLAYTRRVHQLAERLGTRVVFRGRSTDAELERIFENSDVLVVPSNYEGFGIVYLEGMAFGLPAIAGAAGAAGEIIQEGINGSLVPPEDVQALQVALRQMAGDRNRLEKMSRAARKTFESFPTWEDSMAVACEFLHTWKQTPQEGH